MNDLLRIATLALVPSLLLAAACSDDATSTSGGGGSGAGSSEAEVIYEEEATDEALEALLEAPVVEDAAESAYITSPADGDALAASTPPTFEWQVGPEETGSLSTNPDQRFGFVRPPSDAHWSTPDSAEVLSTVAPSLFGVFAPAQPAHAHGTPVNGRGYLFVIEDASGTKVHRVFTLGLEHTPTQAAWDGIAASEGPFKASVTNAIFEANKVVEQGGPFEGPAIGFTIE